MKYNIFYKFVFLDLKPLFNKNILNKNKILIDIQIFKYFNYSLVYLYLLTNYLFYFFIIIFCLYML
jgi:hypothetical protein